MKQLPKLVLFLVAYAVLRALALLGRRAFLMVLILAILLATARACLACR